MHYLLRLLKDEQGATAIEYGFIICLVVLGTIGASVSIGQFVSGSFNQVGKGFATR